MIQEQNKIEMYKNRVDLYNKWNIKSFLPTFTYFSTASSPERFGYFGLVFNSFYVSILYKVSVLEHHLFWTVQ